MISFTIAHYQSILVNTSEPEYWFLYVMVSYTHWHLHKLESQYPENQFLKKKFCCVKSLKVIIVRNTHISLAFILKKSFTL